LYPVRHVSRFTFHATRNEVGEVSEADIRSVLEESKTVAVVGLSPRQERDSHRVAKYLQSQGYRIIPVNPNADEILGERSYPDLTSVPEPIDVVDVFRRSEAVPEIVEEAIKVGAKTVWMQMGVIHEEAAARAREAGLQVVMDRCMMIEHRRHFGQGR
jgi:predicted CoA-binding protein